jgi:hypothetical protein
MRILTMLTCEQQIASDERVSGSASSREQEKIFETYSMSHH